VALCPWCTVQININNAQSHTLQLVLPPPTDVSSVGFQLSTVFHWRQPYISSSKYKFKFNESLNSLRCETFRYNLMSIKLKTNISWCSTYSRLLQHINMFNSWNISSRHNIQNRFAIFQVEAKKMLRFKAIAFSSFFILLDQVVAFTCHNRCWSI